MPYYPPAGSGGGGTWNRLSTATASTSAVIDFTLPAGYSHYKVMLSNVAPATDAVVLWLRTSTDGGSTFAASASDYSYNGLSVDGGGTVGGNASGGAAQIVVGQAAQNIGNATGESISGTLMIYQPSAAARCNVTFEGYVQHSNATYYYTASGGRRLAAADVDAIRFLMSSGNIASGTFELWGMSP